MSGNTDTHGFVQQAKKKKKKPNLNEKSSHFISTPLHNKQIHSSLPRREKLNSTHDSSVSHEAGSRARAGPSHVWFSATPLDRQPSDSLWFPPAVCQSHICTRGNNGAQQEPLASVKVAKQEVAWERCLELINE